MEKHPLVPGLFYHSDCIPSELYDRAMEYILDDDSISWKNVGNGETSRRTSHTGFEYDYKHGDITPSEPIPPVFVELADLAAELCADLELNVEKFNQCLLNEYIADCSHGISWHTDHKSFGPVIACFTLHSGTEMQFKSPSGVIVPVRVEPYSIYIMSGPARWTWKHSMPARKSDPNPAGGKRMQRDDRYSVTFRTVSENI